MSTEKKLIALDSDGCVFNSMEIKQREAIYPAFIQSWDLEDIQEIVIECYSHVGLYSETRGLPRFASLLKAVELLQTRSDHPNIPTLTALKKLIQNNPSLNEADLKELLEKNTSLELKQIGQWNSLVNEKIAIAQKNIQPFENAKKAIPQLAARTTLVVVSTTPEAHLHEEWERTGLKQYTQDIFGLESGGKAETLAKLAKQYPREEMLMVGDALGDAEAANANTIGFFLIRPGDEENSWQELLKQFSSI